MKNSSSKKLNICVIGAGFAGISAATNLANYGHNVFVVEKNSDFGGRARKLKAKGFTFDMGPSWYWMPDVFERHFEINGEKIEDYLKLKRLNPSYKILIGSNEYIDVLTLGFGLSTNLDKWIFRTELGCLGFGKYLLYNSITGNNLTFCAPQLSFGLSVKFSDN